MADSIAAKLDPAHLRLPDTPIDLEKAKQEIVEKTTDKKEEEVVDVDDPKLQREYEFDFDFVDDRGKHWKGRFKSEIPSLRDRRRMGIFQSQLAGGVPFEALDPVTREQCFIIAYLTFFLDFEKRPEWAKDLESVDDNKLVQALYSEVYSHEATFLGRE